MLLRDARNLPDPVLERLAGVDLGPWGASLRGRTLETRPSTEVRAAASGDEVRLVGYATTWDQPYDVYGGPAAYGWSEVMAAGAWDKTLRERHDIRLLVNHDGVPLARFRGESDSTMTLTADETGLLVDASIDASSPYAQAVRSAVTRGDLDQMSCAFQVVRQEWSPDYTERRILEVVGYDVSVVTYPANEATLVMARDGAPAATPGDGPAPLALRLALAEADRLRVRRIDDPLRS